MAEVDKNSAKFIIEPGRPEAASAAFTTDMVLETAPGFAIASLMISSAQAQARALEATAIHQTHAFQTGLATSTQCVVKILDEPSRQQSLLNEMIAANKL